MCGRYRLTRVDKLAGRFGIEPEDDWVPRYNIAPAQNVAVIRQHAEEPKRFGSSMLGADSVLGEGRQRRLHDDQRPCGDGRHQTRLP
jgi:putative SOS response-associated peptidase YedK